MQGGNQSVVTLPDPHATRQASWPGYEPETLLHSLIEFLLDEFGVLLIPILASGISIRSVVEKSIVQTIMETS